MDKPSKGPRRPAKAHSPAAPGSKQPAATQQAFGHLTVGADPYALVRIDGRQVGTTPIVRRRVPVGEHEILLLSPDTGDVRLRRTVRIEEGEHEQVVAR